MSTYGALCSGIGGLELAVEEVFGYELAWHAEIDPDAASVHDRHWPGVPNLGDLTAVDWAEVQPVQLMCFGFPCQDLSHAGKGAGITEGTRSGLWFDCLRAVRVVRPRIVVVENVSALLTRRDGLDFTIVMAGLAEAGYDTGWCCVRASDVGAPHRRERVFILAWDAERPRADALAPTGRPRNTTGESSDGTAADARGAGTGRDGGAVPRTAGGSRWEGVDLHASVDAGSDPASDATGYKGRISDRDSEDAAHADRGRLEVGVQRDRWTHRPGLDPSRRDDAHRRGAAAADPAGEHEHRAGRARGRRAQLADSGRTALDADQQGPQGGEPAAGRIVPSWGDYEPAIRRWEHILGRPAPDPVDGRGRLNPPFVEWMMGYPAGWVDGLTGTAALRCLGNAVVPQQGIAAISTLLDAWEAAA